MKVVIFCGGKGTRLREETEFRPKPMVFVGNRPIIWHIMKYYAHFGHKDFILCLGYKGDMIKDYFRNYLWNSGDVSLSLGRQPKVKFHDRHNEEDWNVTLAETGEQSWTSYRLKMVQRYLKKGETFLLTYGDGVSNIDIKASIASHKKAGKVCTISAVHPTGRFGELKIDDDGTIDSFIEKPQMEASFINGGYMVCDYKVFNYLPEDPFMAFERAPIDKMAAERQLNAFRHEGFWQPMDTYQEHLFLNKLWHDKKAPWKVW